MEWLLAAATLLMVPAAGLAAWPLLWRRSEPAEWWLPLCFALGLGALALAFQWSMVLAGRIAFPLVALLLAALAAASASAWVRAGKPPLLAPFDFGWRTHPLPMAFAGILAIWFLAILYTNAMSFPFTSYDGRAIWNYKAIVFFHERTIAGEAFSDPLRVHYHREYPLLIPSAEFTLYAAMGKVSERPARLLFSSIFAMQLLFLFALLRRMGLPALAAAAATLLYCATPFRDDWAERDGGALNSGAADIPLSFFALVAAASLHFAWRERDRAWPLLGGVFLGLCLMTKNEGLVVLAAATGANLLQAAFGRHDLPRARAFAAALAPAGIAVAVALPWFLLKKHAPIVYDEDYGKQLGWDNIARSLQRIPMILHTLVPDLANVRKWGIFWIAAAALLPFAAVGWVRRRDFFFDAMVLLWIAAYIFVYVVSPLNLNYHLNTSTSRLFSHFLPLVLVRMATFLHARIAPEPA